MKPVVRSNQSPLKPCSCPGAEVIVELHIMWVYIINFLWQGWTEGQGWSWRNVKRGPVCTLCEWHIAKTDNDSD